MFRRTAKHRLPSPPRALSRRQRWAAASAAASMLAVSAAGTALASSVDVSVVDVTVPTTSVTLAPGSTAQITIKLSVTGNQAGTATFEVYRAWTINGGIFTGSDPQEFTVAPRAGGDPATTFSTAGTVSAADTQAAGSFTLTAGAFDVTNSNSTGAKLAAGAPSNYQVTVSEPADPCASVAAPAAPTFSAIPSPADGDNGWYTSVPSVSASSSTPGATIDYATEVDGVKSAYSATAPTLGEGTTKVYGRATSATCAKTSEATETFRIDTVAPSVTPDSVNDTIWRNTPLQETFTATDSPGSGVAGDNPVTVTASNESADATTPTVVSHMFLDVAGNHTQRSVSAFIDLTGPSTSVTGVQDGETYTLGSVPAAGCATVDSLSDVDVNASLSTSGGPVGAVTVTCSGARDNAGNTGDPASATFTVAYAWSGFFKPIDGGEIYNVVKAGSAVPTKFSLDGNQGLGIFAAGYPLSAKIPCDANAPQDNIELTLAAGSSSLSYDSVADQYNYVWKTDKAWAGTCRQLTVKLIDGTTHTAKFNLAK